MKKLVTMCAVLCMAATAAQGALLYWDGCKPSGGVSQGVVQGDGKWTAWSAYPDGWSASTALSSVRNNTAPHNVTQAAYNTTSGQAAYAEIEFYLPATGYWEIAATQTATSLGAGVKTVTNLGGWVGLPTTTTMFTTGNVWNSMGTYQATTTTPKIRFAENATTTNRWYLDQIRLTSATPGQAALTGPANGATDVALDADLAWSAGSFTSFFDVFFSVNPNPDSFATDLAGGTSSLDLGTLAENTTYYWKVRAKNVDQTADSEIYSFTTLPEPAAVVLLALSSVLLVPRRRRA